MTGPDIFAPAESPPRQAGLSINRVASWFTWSSEFRAVIRELDPWLRRIEEPKLVKIKGLKGYDYTFAVPAYCPDILRPFIRSLCGMRRPRGIMLFTGLLDRHLDAFIFRRLFAVLRGGIARLLDDERFSLYAPLSNTGKHAGDFALHSDLYLPELLFNVFELVPRDSSGASIFLSARELARILRQAPVPQRIISEVEECLTERCSKDRFHKFFDALHDPSRPWANELADRLAKSQMAIKFAPGQGYLLHDRTWLHGRKAATGGVSLRRVHRLVFNTTALQRRWRADVCTTM